MSDGPRAAFEHTSDAAQRIAGVIAARDRGDFAGADALLATLDEGERAAGAVFLADLAVGLLARSEGRSAGEIAGDLSLHIAAGP